jgi:hypothetical protein
MQPKTKTCVIIWTAGGGSRGGAGHWNISTADPNNGSAGFQRRFVCLVGKQSVWLLEHVTGIAATRSKSRDRSWP